MHSMKKSNVHNLKKCDFLVHFVTIDLRPPLWADCMTGARAEMEIAPYGSLDGASIVLRGATRAC